MSTTPKTTPEISRAAVSRESVRPGMLEVLIGLVMLGLFALLYTLLLAPALSAHPITSGIISTFLSGVLGAAAFVAAWTVRRRPWSSYGVRATTARWLVLGVAGGIAGILAKGVVGELLLRVLEAGAFPQETYAAGASGGILAVVLTAIGLAIVTPIGEELFFRGVVTSWLMRFTPLVTTLVSASLFALVHGMNIVLPTAFIIGVITAELRRRSGSIWPGTVVHVMNNAVTVVAYAAAPHITA